MSSSTTGTSVAIFNSHTEYMQALCEALEGEGLTVNVLAETQSIPHARFEPLKEMFRGPMPDARAVWVGNSVRLIAVSVCPCAIVSRCASAMLPVPG